MNRIHGLILLAGLIISVVISGRFILLAQDRPGAAAGRVRTEAPASEAAKPESLPDLTGPETRGQVEHVPQESTRPPSLPDALLQPYRFPFSRPTPLQEVCVHLQKTLKAGVVLDKAALERHNVKPEDPVQLELDGARLKTGLKLVLDQLGLTFRVVAEDNLLIITDREGSDESTERIWSELRALHRDLHDLQDAVDDLRDFLGDQGVEGPQVRNPTIIEEMPERGAEKPGPRPDKPGDGRQKPDGSRAPQPGARRIPHGSRCLVRTTATDRAKRLFVAWLADQGFPDRSITIFESCMPIRVPFSFRHDDAAGAHGETGVGTGGRRE